jgi:hypothetical protein
MAGARIEDLPVGLDWQAFQSRCFPGGRGHDSKALGAYSAYRQRLRETPEGDAVTASAVATWEDEGGSTPQADHQPPRHNGRTAGAFQPPDCRSGRRLGQITLFA